MTSRHPGALPFGLVLVAIVAVVVGNMLSRDVAVATPAPVAEAPADGASAPVTASPGCETAFAAARAPAELPRQLRLRVVDAITRAPVCGASVALQHDDGAALRGANTDAEGRVRFAADAAMPLRLTIRGAGYVTLRAVLPAVAEDEPILAMQPAGSLVVCVTDSRGAPARGVAIAMLPPPSLCPWPVGDFVAYAREGRDAGAAHADVMPTLELVDGVYVAPDVSEDAHFRRVAALWSGEDRQRITDERGEVRWHGLPPAAGYRFGILPPDHGDPVPPHERRRLVPGSQGVAVDRAPPPGLSGAFEVRLAAPTVVTATITSNGTVRGRFDVPRGVRAATTLLSVTQAGGGDVTAVTALDVTATLTAEADGSFRFEHVRPGIYALRARWVEALGEVRIASVTLQVPAGVDVDLGVVPSLCGSDLAVRVQLQDLGGRPLTPEMVFQDASQAAALLRVDTVPASHALADTLSEQASIPFGAALLVHGLPAGLARVSVRPADGATTLGTIAEIPCAEPVDVPLPQSGIVDVPLRVAFGHVVAFDCRDERGVAHDPLQLWLRDRRTGRVGAHRVPAARDGSGVTLRDGEYEVFGASRLGATTLCATAMLDVPRGSPTPMVLTFRTGASVAGRLVDVAGAPVAGRALRWTLPDWAGASATWLFVATTDADGRFELQGVPTGVRLLADAGTPELAPLAAGDNRLVLVAEAK